MSSLAPLVWTHPTSATMRQEVCHVTTEALHQTIQGRSNPVG